MFDRCTIELLYIVGRCPIDFRSETSWCIRAHRGDILLYPTWFGQHVLCFGNTFSWLLWKSAKSRGNEASKPRSLEASKCLDGNREAKSIIVCFLFLVFTQLAWIIHRSLGLTIRLDSPIVVPGSTHYSTNPGGPIASSPCRHHQQKYRMTDRMCSRI